MSRALPAALAGAAVGVAASVIQAAIGKTEDLLFLPPSEDSNFAPRLMDRLARDAGTELSPSAEWGLGTAFHIGYGAAWGALYALAHERLRPHPLLGGAALGGLIYALAFPRWGVAVRTQTERPPALRTRRMTLVATSVALGYGLATAYGYRAVRDLV